MGLTWRSAEKETTTLRAMVTAGRCHNVVTSAREYSEPVGDGMGLIPLVGALLGLTQDASNQLRADWGSSGRRFKPCQPPEPVGRYR
jgi:hypothetical protein